MINDESKTVLFIDSSTGYTMQLCHFMKQYYPELSIRVITNIINYDTYKSVGQSCYDEIIFYSNARFFKTFSFLGALKKMKNVDIVHTLWIEKLIGIGAFWIKKKSKVWLASVGGSDLYRHSSIPDNRRWQDKVLKYASGFSSENSSTREYFYKVYGDNLRSKLHNINRYGVDIIDELRLMKKEETKSIKEKWDISDDKIVIMLGHNARVEHQHREMISAISSMKEEDREKCFFVIPMTYPSGVNDYIHEIDDMMKACTSQYQILTEYMDVTEMAEVTKCCDVMIHVQTTDQLSSTMVAHMYDENIVIAGSWLPYSDLRNNGIKFYDVDEICEIQTLLTNIVKNFDRYKEEVKGNKETVYKFSSWEYAAKAWYNTYIELLEENKK